MTLEQKPWPGNLARRVREIASPDARIALLWGSLAGDAALVADLAHSLSPAEHARASRFGSDALRERYVIGRGTLRAALARHLDVPPQDVELARGRRGRPQLALQLGLDFNVSHTAQVMLIAIARGVTVGVDVEATARSINTSGIARRCLSAAERQALEGLDGDHARRRVLQLWTCKEAMSKATGDALSAPFRRLEVELSAPRRHDSELSRGHDAALPERQRLDFALPSSPRLRDGPSPYTPGDWSLHALVPPEPYFATLAVWTRVSSIQS